MCKDFCSVRWSALAQEIADFLSNTRQFCTLRRSPFAFPPALVEPCILAGCRAGGTVLDPFLGAGTTALVADRLGRDCIGIELNPAYAEMARRRIDRAAPERRQMEGDERHSSAIGAAEPGPDDPLPPLFAALMPKT